MTAEEAFKNMPQLSVAEENGMMPAHPCEEAGVIHVGLTKRELFAAMAMQGLISSDTHQELDPSVVSNAAVAQADALLEALSEVE